MIIYYLKQLCTIWTVYLTHWIHSTSSLSIHDRKQLLTPTSSVKNTRSNSVIRGFTSCTLLVFIASMQSPGIACIWKSTIVIPLKSNALWSSFSFRCCAFIHSIFGWSLIAWDDTNVTCKGTYDYWNCSHFLNWKYMQDTLVLHIL